MIADNFLVLDFRPLFLTLEGIGPFQDKPFQLDFTDSNDEPCNFFLLLSKNGMGKTTLIELMAALMGLFELRDPSSLGIEDLDSGSGRAQWDFLVRVRRDGEETTRLLSLVAGRDQPWGLNPWGKSRLAEYGAEARTVFGFIRHASGRLTEVGRLPTIHPESTGEPKTVIDDGFIEDLLAAMRSNMERAPDAFEDDPLTMPTLLYFSAYRDIPKVKDWDRGVMQPESWGYRPVHRFGTESQGWRGSLDNLLVWLKWLDDGRYERAIEVINDRVFEESIKFLKGVRKQPPEAQVFNGEHRHRLDQLSSGEKSLVQLYLRTGIHMTRNTLLLVDELDIHLHSIWQHRVLAVFKQLAIDHPGMTIITSTHARELIPAFGHDIREEGLRKGGHIIEEGLT
jgi:energy-coupling factor transporter ATP-binding protein EcfA2